MALNRKGKPLPTEEDLEWEDGIPMEGDAHVDQVRVYLVHPLRRLIKAGIIPTAYVSGNSFVYYDPEDIVRKRVGPDFYCINGGPAERHHGWVAWEHGDLLPTLVVEISSKSTVREDRNRKFVLYRDVFKTPDYFLFHIERQRLEGFRLEGGAYVVSQPDNNGRMACSSLPLLLGLHDGWLRFYTPDGSLVPTGEEAQRHLADAERQRADAERQRADAAQAEVHRLMEQLRRIRQTD